MGVRRCSNPHTDALIKIEIVRNRRVGLSSMHAHRSFPSRDFLLPTSSDTDGLPLLFIIKSSSRHKSLDQRVEPDDLIPSTKILAAQQAGLGDIELWWSWLQALPQFLRAVEEYRHETLQRWCLPLSLRVENGSIVSGRRTIIPMTGEE